jgi:serine/threonine protein phosphatase PrpC
MTPPFDAAGYRAAKAPIYPQALVRCWHDKGVFLVVAGGGGGAAQMMPSRELNPALESASRASRASAVEGDSAQRLNQLFEQLDQAVGKVVDRRGPGPDAIQMYKGSSAQVVGCIAGEGCFWFGNVGLGRGYGVGPGTLIQLTRDDSLLQDYIESGATQEEIATYPHQGIVTAVLDGRWRGEHPAWQPVSSPVAGLRGFLLATGPACHAAPETTLAQWCNDALAAPDLASAVRDLWHRLRACLENDETIDQRRSGSQDPRGLALAEYDRRAAVLLIRCGGER